MLKMSDILKTDFEINLFHTFYKRKSSFERSVRSTSLFINFPNYLVSFIKCTLKSPSAIFFGIIMRVFKILKENKIERCFV